MTGSQGQEGVEARWDESLALAFHDAIDGDFLVAAAGDGSDVGINRLRVSEVVRWATKAVLASDWLAQHVDAAPCADCQTKAAAIARGNPHTEESP